MHKRTGRVKQWLSRGLMVFGGLALAWTVYGWILPETLDVPPSSLSTRPDADLRGSAVTLAANLDAPVVDGNSISRSFTLNYEAVVAVYDRDFVKKLNASYRHDLTRAREITLADVEDWSALERLRNHLALLLRAQL